MKLKINTSSNQKIVIQLGKKRLVRIIKVGETSNLLSLINRIIKTTGSSINQIKEIEVNLGPGSFTSLRIGVAVANALGWALKIPVNGKRQIVIPVYE